MKKWVAAVAIVSLLTTGGTSVMAQGNAKQKVQQKQDTAGCTKIPPGLQNALSKVKNTKARASIEKNIGKYMEKCKKEKEDPQLTDAQRVEKDKAALQIGFTGNDTASRVTSALQLPAKGKYGSAITWKSGNTAVISDNGLTVTRPQGQDATVVMTATVKYNSVTATKTFTLKVTANPVSLTPAQIVAKDKEALQVGFNGTDTASQVTQALKSLPATGGNGSEITWISGASAVISNDGKTVNRPAAGSGDVTVVMTAIIRYQTVTEVKTFQLTVKQQLTDEQKVAADKAALAIDFGGSDTADRVTRPLDALPAKGAEGASITWMSGAPHILSGDGKTLNRPAADTADTTVVMTAVITSGTVTDVKTFVLTVKKQYTTMEKLASDKAELDIKFAEGDSASSVTKALTLPATGYFGSTVIWYSNSPSIVSDNGKTVNRPAKGQADATVTMMAFISNNEVGDMKTFTLTVKAQQ